MSIRRVYRLPFRRMLLLVVLPVLALSYYPHRTQEEATLHIKPLQRGAPPPDGFYVYRRLHEQGIAIKSITPAQDSIVVHLESPAQSVVAGEVLRRSLPHVVITTRRAPAPSSPFWQQKSSKIG